MSVNQWIELAGQPYRDACQRAAEGDPRDAEIERLRTQIDQYIADALIRAHRQCIAIEALTAIRNNTALPYQTRHIAAHALVQIEAVQP